MYGARPLYVPATAAAGPAAAAAELLPYAADRGGRGAPEDARGMRGYTPPVPPGPEDGRSSRYGVDRGTYPAPTPAWRPAPPPPPPSAREHERERERGRTPLNFAPPASYEEERPPSRRSYGRTPPPMRQRPTYDGRPPQAEPGHGPRYDVRYGTPPPPPPPMVGPGDGWVRQQQGRAPPSARPLWAGPPSMPGLWPPPPPPPPLLPAADDPPSMPGLWPQPLPPPPPLSADGLLEPRGPPALDGAPPPSLDLGALALRLHVAPGQPLAGVARIKVQFAGQQLRDRDIVALANVLLDRLRAEAEARAPTMPASGVPRLLVDLHGEYNDMRDAGGAAVVAALVAAQHSHRVATRGLYLFNNALGDAAADAVAHLLRTQASWCPSEFMTEEVHLSHNRITEAGAQPLLDVCAALFPTRRHNGVATPLWLRLEYNGIDVQRCRVPRLHCLAEHRGRRRADGSRERTGNECGVHHCRLLAPALHLPPPALHLPYFLLQRSSMRSLLASVSSGLAPVAARLAASVAVARPPASLMASPGPVLPAPAAAEDTAVPPPTTAEPMEGVVDATPRAPQFTPADLLLVLVDTNAMVKLLRDGTAPFGLDTLVGLASAGQLAPGLKLLVLDTVQLELESLKSSPAATASRAVARFFRENDIRDRACQAGLLELLMRDEGEGRLFEEGRFHRDSRTAALDRGQRNDNIIVDVAHLLYTDLCNQLGPDGVGCLMVLSDDAGLRRGARQWGIPALGVADVEAVCRARPAATLLSAQTLKAAPGFNPDASTVARPGTGAGGAPLKAPRQDLMDLLDAAVQLLRGYRDGRAPSASAVDDFLASGERALEGRHRLLERTAAVKE